MRVGLRAMTRPCVGGEGGNVGAFGEREGRRVTYAVRGRKEC